MRRAEKSIFLSPEEYLAIEETAEVRHEYVDGALVAMVGATIPHVRIVRNLVQRLDPKLRRPCEVLFNDAMVRVEAANAYYYPDAVVSCSQTASDPRLVSDPILVIEVLSDTTAHRDRSEKRRNYQRIPSLRAILLIDQARRHVELDRRTNEGWERITLTDEGALDLPGLDVTLDMDEIYAD